MLDTKSKGTVSVRQVVFQQRKDIAAHYLGDLFSAKPFIYQGFGYQRQTGGVKRRDHRAVKIRAERDVFAARDIGRVTDRFGDRRRICAADGGVPKTDADHAPGSRDAPDLVVGEIAII